MAISLVFVFAARPHSSCQSLPDGEVRPVSGANSNRALRCFSSYDDGWLLEYQCFARDRLKNPFSHATIDIACCFDQPIKSLDFLGDDGSHSINLAAFTLPKIIVCSSGALVVAAVVHSNCIAAFRPGIDHSWSVFSGDEVMSTGDDDDNPRMMRRRKYEDIALYRGKLYDRTGNEELLVHEINDGIDTISANAVLSRAEHAIRAGAVHHPLTLLERIHSYNSDESLYLVISCSGKLLMIRCTTKYSRDGTSSMGGTTIKFKVFEADLEGGQWLEVNSLDGQIIFLSKACSKAIPRSPANGDPRFAGNSIFFLGDDITRWWYQIQTNITSGMYEENEGIPMYGVYDLSTSAISLIYLGRKHRHSKICWFFPGM